MSARDRRWRDKPTRRGAYWVSPFMNGKYAYPHVMHVIDYERPDRGLEVEYGSVGSLTIPVNRFVAMYYPKAKWMYIPVPRPPEDTRMIELFVRELRSRMIGRR